MKYDTSTLNGIILQYERHNKLVEKHEIYLEDQAPKTKYTRRAKTADCSMIHVNAMNGWIEEGRKRFEELFRVKKDRKYRNVSFN